MNVPKLFDKLPFAPNVEIVITRLPERIFRSQGETPRHSLLQGLQGLRQSVPFRFVQEEMDVFRHHHVTVDAQDIGLANSFERLDKSLTGVDLLKIRAAVIAAKRQEMNISGFLEALQSPRHGVKVR
jgi:hypothetical protein